MHLTFRNANDCFRGLVEGIHKGIIYTDVETSRYGEVIRVQEPVLITYTNPTEKVLFNSARDHNCFLALYEALWMLAGRNDVAPLAYYCSRMPEFSDDGKTFNGAYGYRWRMVKGEQILWAHDKSGPGYDDYATIDQLDTIIEHLRCRPESRRAVLQMWTVEDDLLKIDSGRDVCCNTCIYFLVEQGLCRECNGKTDHGAPGPCVACGGMPHDRPRYLNMTVCNRSNDLTWGLLGSNYVCFSILQEYVAAHLGLDVGRYHHFTNNLHAYTNKWHPREWLQESNAAGADAYASGKWNQFGNRPLALIPLVRDPKAFNRELLDFVQFHGSEQTRYDGSQQRWDEPFLETVAGPMLDAFHMRRLGDRDLALDFASKVAADDWRIAVEGWLRRRYEKRRAAESEEVYDPDFAV